MEEVEKVVEVKELEIEEGVNVARCCPLPVLIGNNRVPLYNDSVDSYIGILHYYPLSSLSKLDRLPAHSVICVSNQKEKPASRRVLCQAACALAYVYCCIANGKT